MSVMKENRVFCYEREEKRFILGWVGVKVGFFEKELEKDE